MKKETYAQARRRNPFISMNLGSAGEYAMACDADSRIQKAKTFDAAQVRAALKLQGLQKTVRQALERRQRQLEGKHHAR